MNPTRVLEEIGCVLLVDDDKITNILHSRLLKICNIHCPVEIVTSGAKALDFLTCKGEFADYTNARQPGIILLDINMPLMNGWEFLDEYKKFDEKQKSKIFIVMLTSSIDPIDKRRADKNEDIKMFLNKPLTKENLLKVIHNYYLYISGISYDGSIETMHLSGK